MDQEFAKSKKIDRSLWKSGSWDNEPDYCEWITAQGHSTWAARLPSGAWYLVMEVPFPTESIMRLAFLHTMRDLYYKEISATPGMTAPTDKEDISQFIFSMEHWESPGSSERTWWRGPYKTLEAIKERSEILSDRISKIHKEDKYKNYFEHLQ